MKKVLALALVAAMLMVMVSVALADATTTHTITITNTDQYVSHIYKAYQVFTGDGDGSKLSNVRWGNGVTAASIISDLLASSDSDLAPLKTALSALDDTAADYQTKAAVAITDALGVSANYSSTNATPTTAAGALDKFAAIVAKYVTGTPDAFTETSGTYTKEVTGDGYYIIIDSTADNTLENTSGAGSDTKSKHILVPVLTPNVPVVAKDDHLTPEKKINDGTALVDENSAAIGDVVDFVVYINVPNTTKYQNGFAFEMHDTLPKGLTFMAIDGITVVNSSDDVITNGTLASADYTVTVDDPTYSGDPETATYNNAYTTYTPPASDAAAVDVKGGEKIQVVFNDFKTKAETNSWTGNRLKITYHAVVNRYADFTTTGNENEVYFKYANDPNSNYTGTNPNSPMGETPHDKTKTLLINLEILKVDALNHSTVLPGAVFEITGTTYNVTLVNGEKYVQDPTAGGTDYEPGDGESVNGTAKTYYKLKDGTYTTTPPAADGSDASFYDNTSVTYTRITFSHSKTTPEGSPKTVTVTTGADGKIRLEGLNAGTYTIKEIQAPKGYNLDSTEYTVKINWNKTTTAFEKDGSSSATVEWDSTGTTATASITIGNKSGTVLPSTGGIGTTIFYVSGLIMVLGASIILVARRRADAE